MACKDGYDVLPSPRRHRFGGYVFAIHERVKPFVGELGVMGGRELRSPCLRVHHPMEERVPCRWRPELDIGEEGMSASREPIATHKCAVEKGPPIVRRKPSHPGHKRR